MKEPIGLDGVALLVGTLVLLWLLIIYSLTKIYSFIGGLINGL